MLKSDLEGLFDVIWLPPFFKGKIGDGFSVAYVELAHIIFLARKFVVETITLSLTLANLIRFVKE